MNPVNKKKTLTWVWLISVCFIYVPTVFLSQLPCWVTQTLSILGALTIQTDWETIDISADVVRLVVCGIDGVMIEATWSRHCRDLWHTMLHSSVFFFFSIYCQWIKCNNTYEISFWLSDSIHSNNLNWLLWRNFQTPSRCLSASPYKSVTNINVGCFYPGSLSFSHHRELMTIDEELYFNVFTIRLHHLQHVKQWAIYQQNIQYDIENTIIEYHWSFCV